ncbi:hypothetical protein ACFL4G_00400 [Thermodesulfobacteriota bacterium]
MDVIPAKAGIRIKVGVVGILGMGDPRLRGDDRLWCSQQDGMRL